MCVQYVQVQGDSGLPPWVDRSTFLQTLSCPDTTPWPSGHLLSNPSHPSHPPHHGQLPTNPPIESTIIEPCLPVTKKSIHSAADGLASVIGTIVTHGPEAEQKIPQANSITNNDSSLFLPCGPPHLPGPLVGLRHSHVLVRSPLFPVHLFGTIVSVLDGPSFFCSGTPSDDSCPQPSTGGHHKNPHVRLFSSYCPSSLKGYTPFPII